MIDADIAIVGYGPVGNALAILLAQLGRRVVVLERWPEPYPLPRAVHFDHEVGRIFQACGIGDEIRAISEPAAVYEWRNAAGTTLLRFGREGDGPSGWPASSMVNQPAIERLLDERARTLGVEVRRGVEVTRVDQRDDHVVVGGAEGPILSASYVIGCDGANSTVRTRLDLPVTDLGFFYDWLIVDVILDEPRVFDPINLQICDPARPTTVVSGGPGRRRWEFMKLPDESLDELHDEQRAWELLEPWDVHPGNARLERHAVYTFNARYAEAWRAGRVLIAGDAAHLMPPFAGQGLCSGLRDAANLAWKLDLALDGRAAPALLDSYESERMPSARAAIEFSIELGKVICVPDPAEAAGARRGDGRRRERYGRLRPACPTSNAGSSIRPRRMPAPSSCRARSVAARSTRCTATAGASSCATPTRSPRRRGRRRRRAGLVRDDRRQGRRPRRARPLVRSLVHRARDGVRARCAPTSISTAPRRRQRVRARCSPISAPTSQRGRRHEARQPRRPRRARARRLDRRRRARSPADGSVPTR